MNRFFKILIILVFASAFGYLLGVYNTPQTIVVYDSAGQVIQSGTGQGGLSQIFFPGLKLESLPWYIARSSAIAAYLLLFFVVIWGMGMKIGWTYKLFDPARAWQIHQNFSIAFGVLILVHAFSLLFDKFINFGWLDILIPFYSSFKPVFLSTGIVAFYLLLVIILTSLFLRLKMPRLWRNSHYLSYILFAQATFHGFFIGTDSTTVLMQIVYGAATLIFIFFLIVRSVVYPWQIRRLRAAKAKQPLV